MVATLNPSETVTISNNNGLNTYIFAQNGQFTFQFVDAVGNTGSAVAAVNWIDKDPPTATIAYAPDTATNQDVVATLNPSETVTITNNNGLNTYRVYASYYVINSGK